MDFTVNRADLAAALATVAGTISRKNTIPVLANVRIIAKGKFLSLTGTDMDMEQTVQLPAEIRKEGETTAPAHTLHDIVRKVSEESVNFKQPNPARLAITAGKSKFQLGTMPTVDFPSFRELNDIKFSVSLSADGLRRILDRASVCISTEETRYYLNGIFFEMAENEDGSKKFQAVATDGHKLCYVETPAETETAEIPGIILPRKACAEIRKMLEGIDGELNLVYTMNILTVTVDNKTLKTKLIDGSFPDYQRVIPKGNDKKLKIDAQALAVAADRTITISSKKSNALRLDVTTSGVKLAATGDNDAAASEDIDGHFEAGPITIGFNGGYLIDVLKNLKGEISILMNDQSSAAIIRDDNDPTLLYVIMPMRV